MKNDVAMVLRREAVKIKLTAVQTHPKHVSRVNEMHSFTSIPRTHRHLSHHELSFHTSNIWC